MVVVILDGQRLQQGKNRGGERYAQSDASFGSGSRYEPNRILQVYLRPPSAKRLIRPDAREDCEFERTGGDVLALA